jgi:hypothetical protein
LALEAAGSRCQFMVDGVRCSENVGLEVLRLDGNWTNNA